MQPRSNSGPGNHVELGFQLRLFADIRAKNYQGGRIHQHHVVAVCKVAPQAIKAVADSGFASDYRSVNLKEFPERLRRAKHGLTTGRASADFFQEGLIADFALLWLVHQRLDGHDERYVSEGSRLCTYRFGMFEIDQSSLESFAILASKIEDIVQGTFDIVWEH